MCFTKSEKVPSVEIKEPILRHEANASVTKNSSQQKDGYRQNVLTSAFGLENEAKTSKKTLLGE